METTVTTLLSHEAVAMNGQNGPWTLNKFQAQDGRTYQTTKVQLASEALASLNKPVSVNYETTTRAGRNGNTFTNYEIQSVVAADTTAPATATPRSASVPQAASRSGDVHMGLGGLFESQRQTSIMRQNALTRALEMSGQGIIKVDGFLGLIKVAESCVKYYGGGFDHLLNGSAAVAQSVTPASPPGDGGGTVAGAAPAVASAPSSKPTAADDGVPF